MERTRSLVIAPSQPSIVTQYTYYRNDSYGGDATPTAYHKEEEVEVAGFGNNLLPPS